MPYFKWTGVNIAGDFKKGKLVAYSEVELSQRLFQRGIALLDSKSLYTHSIFWKINDAVKAQVFAAIARLLHAGILMPDVFVIAAQQLDNPFLYDALFEWAADLKKGISFESTVKQQNILCDEIVKTMLIVGHESNFTIAIENVAHYYQLRDIFKKNIRACLAMPLLTFLFFVGITLLIFIGIMPRFAQMFLSMNSELPPLTMLMIHVSSFVSSWSMVYVISVCIATGIMLYYYLKKSGAKIGDRICMHAPFFGKIMHYYQLSQFLQALSLLIKSDVSLVRALQILHNSTHNYVVKKYIEYLYTQVQSGMLLSHALSTMFIFSSDIIALITIGEETGSLDASLSMAANIYKESMQSTVTRLLFFIQPIAIIVLGILIGILILAVYLPIMNFSYSI